MTTAHRKPTIKTAVPGWAARYGVELALSYAIWYGLAAIGVGHRFGYVVDTLVWFALNAIMVLVVNQLMPYPRHRRPARTLKIEPDR